MFAEEFGQLVRLRRLSLGMTAQDAYEAAGLSPKTWKRIEEGSSVKSNSITKLDHALNEPAGTLTKIWNDQDIEELKRRWSTEPAGGTKYTYLECDAEPASPASVALPEADIHLSVGTQQYDESLRFLLRHDAESLRLLSGPVYQAMKYRAEIDRRRRLTAIQSERGEVESALKESSSETVARYLRQRLEELADQEDVVHKEKQQYVSFIEGR